MPEQTDYRLPCGKHRNQPLAEVPTKYLHWFLGTCRVGTGLKAAVAGELARRGADPPRASTFTAQSANPDPTTLETQPMARQRPPTPPPNLEPEQPRLLLHLRGQSFRLRELVARLEGAFGVMRDVPVQPAAEAVVEIERLAVKLGRLTEEMEALAAQPELPFGQHQEAGGD